MPFLLRCTFFMRDTKGYGWTETYHSNKTALLDLQGVALKLGLQRRNLLGSTARMLSFRVSDDLIKRDSRVFRFPPGDQTTRVGGGNASDIANTSLVVRVETANDRVRRTVYMRGIPDSIIVNAGEFQPDQVWSDTFAGYLDLLKADGWVCRSNVDQPATEANVTAVSQNFATGVTLITCDAGIGVALDKPVQIRGARGCPQINGTWRVLSVVSSGVFNIQVNTLLAPYQGGGKAKNVGYLTYPITDAFVNGVSHRNAGRPLGLPPGRRRARSRR